MELANALNPLERPFFFQIAVCCLSAIISGFGFFSIIMKLKSITPMAPPALLYYSFSVSTYPHLKVKNTTNKNFLISYLQTSFYLYRAYMLISSNHHLCLAMRERGEEIEEFLTECSILNETIDDHLFYRIQTFCKKIKRDSKFSPLNLFSMNNGAFLSIVATAMTYIVVMVQFKTTQLPLKA